MKLVAVLLALMALSFSLHAETIIKGEEAKALFDNLKGYEYSSAAITTGIEYRSTVRHNDQVSCEKEETIYTSQSQVEYTCTVKN